ncbi:hypothetical protein E3E12_07780 [Formicincola oecophyllae]|uniref:Uncharacterized protein n=1 Tax=Formicincola oecophyllae TaxID=2558361 RepID=A0A4Y6UDJ5_9PROT|nr:hypothetical protein [Formicincola oecophyllae]QDH14095.1 hypothetical protein E3E12_07780 [Formicincola oecophyllae]
MAKAAPALKTSKATQANPTRHPGQSTGTAKPCPSPAAEGPEAAQHVRQLAQLHGADAITVLADIMMTAPDPKVQMAAAKELLDWGFNPKTAPEGNGGQAPFQGFTIQFVQPTEPEPAEPAAPENAEKGAETGPAP